MSILEAIFLGIIQGIAEFLPISSSGHLAIFQKVFGMKEAGMSFDVFLHLGTLLAVFAVYWKDILRLIADGVGIIVDSVYNAFTYINCKRTKDTPVYRRVINSAYRKFALLVIVSTIPTAIIGFVGEELVEQASDTLIVPGICLLITAILLFIADNVPDGSKTPKKTSYLNALFIGVCQGISTLPGLSRSGTTITAGLLSGLRRDFAVKYSFIMSIPAILGAAILKIPKMKADLVSTSAACYVSGIIVSAVVGYICIKTMLVVVRNKNFKYFSAYCLVVGFIAIIASFFIY
ncbi:MAG: undecaprenyl-diphosphate phosphatase [Eubacterium sp.]